MNDDSEIDENSSCQTCGMAIESCTCATILSSAEHGIVSAPKKSEKRVTAYDPGTELDHRYKIVRKIGVGGMGTVYEAEHLILKSRVAVKVLRAEFLENEPIQRFLQEARACAKLRHPHLVTVYDCGMSPYNEPFLVMEFLEGETLLNILKSKKKFSLSEVLNIFLPITDALAYAHRHGVIHRDLKPSNIVFTIGPADLRIPKIVDFGVAKIEDLGSQIQMLTHTGQVLGSPSYMSPEQCQGQEIDSRSDVYAIGCLMFEALAGRQAFRGHNIMATLEKQIYDTPELPPSVSQEEKEAFEIILKTLEKDPDARYQTCEDLKRALVALESKTKKSRNKDSNVLPKVAGIAFASMAFTIAAITLAHTFQSSPPEETKHADSSARAKANSVLSYYWMLDGNRTLASKVLSETVDESDLTPLERLSRRLLSMKTTQNNIYLDDQKLKKDELTKGERVKLEEGQTSKKSYGLKLFKECKDDLESVMKTSGTGKKSAVTGDILTLIYCNGVDFERLNNFSAKRLIETAYTGANLNNQFPVSSHVRAKALRRLADAYWNSGEDRKAMQTFAAAGELFDKSQDSDNVGWEHVYCYKSLFEICRDNKRPEARSYYNKALKLAKESSDEVILDELKKILPKQ